MNCAIFFKTPRVLFFMVSYYCMINTKLFLHENPKTTIVLTFGISHY